MLSWVFEEDDFSLIQHFCKIERGHTLSREEDHVLFPILWYPNENSVNGIPMQINKTESSSTMNILQYEVHQKGCFSAPWSANHIQTMKPLFWCESDKISCMNIFSQDCGDHTHLPSMSCESLQTLRTILPSKK